MYDYTINGKQSRCLTFLSSVQKLKNSPKQNQTKTIHPNTHTHTEKQDNRFEEKKNLGLEQHRLVVLRQVFIVQQGEVLCPFPGLFLELLFKLQGTLQPERVHGCRRAWASLQWWFSDLQRTASEGGGACGGAKANQTLSVPPQRWKI